MAGVAWDAYSVRGDLLDLEELQLITFLDVVVVLELDTALEAFAHLAHVVLEALDRVDFAGVDHHVVAQQAEMRAAVDRTRSDHTTCDRTDLGRHEHGADLGRADDLFAPLGASMPDMATLMSSTAS
jgi:hypothetical protein